MRSANLLHVRREIPDIEVTWSKRLDGFSSLPAAFHTLAWEHPLGIAYSQSHLDDKGSGDLRPRRQSFTTYRVCQRRVLQIAAYLRSHGLKRGDCVLILSASRPEWLEADFGIMSAGGVVVPAYHTMPQNDLAFILNETSCRIAFVENQEQADKLRRLGSLGASGQPSGIERIISFERAEPQAEVTYLGEIFERQSPLAAAETTAAAREDISSIVYTSGTTGDPKGVLQTHGNHLANIRQVLEAEIIPKESRIMLLLPLAHSFPRLAGYLSFLSSARLCFPAVIDRERSRQSAESLLRDLRESGANIVPLVPHLLMKMQRLVQKRAMQSGLLSSAIRLTIWVALQKQGLLSRVTLRSLPIALLFSLTAPIRRRIKHGLFGSAFEFAVSGGAPLPSETAGFFDALGIEVLNGYGLTETCVALTSQRPGKKKPGTVGEVLAADIELKIAPDGEILVRGPTVTPGYYRRSEETKESWIENGWFCTGDLGRLDDEGSLHITGRKKEIIITSGAKNIYPCRIEEKLRLSSPLISQALVLGDGKEHLGALLALDSEELARWAESEGVEGLSEPEAAKHPRLLEHLWSSVQRINRNLAQHERIRRIAPIFEAFSVENGLLTPTLKLKRQAVKERFRHLIQGLFE